MDCQRYENLLPAHAGGDLTAAEAAEIERHLAECPACREALQSYRSVIGSVAASPILTPTATESAALAAALSRLPIAAPAPARATPPSPQGLLGFAAASLAVFLLVATGLMGRVFDLAAPISLPGSIGPAKLVAIAVVVIFVTSFVPIAVTARRRPLNGLTFSR